MPTFKRYQGKHINSKHPHYKTARWWYQFRIRGKTYTGPLPEASTKKDADDVEAAIRAALFKTKYGGGLKSWGLVNTLTKVICLPVRSKRRRIETTYNDQES